MEINIAKSAGFCFGVRRAVDTVYKESAKKNVYTYGPIIHNDEVVADLERQGVGVINDSNEFRSLGKGTIIIRSHGVPKAIYDEIADAGLDLVDATCPFVRKIHRIVEKESGDGRVVIIVGNNHHPEVEGIMGWCHTTPIVIENREQAEAIAVDRQEHKAQDDNNGRSNHTELAELNIVKYFEHLRPAIELLILKAKVINTDHQPFCHKQSCEHG